MRFIHPHILGYKGVFLLNSRFDIPCTHFRICSGASGKGSRFNVEPHFHPNSTEYFVITKGQAHFTLDGKPHTVEEGGHFVIPRGAVHTVSSPENEFMEFKARGDLDLVAERDFLMQMFALIETVSFSRPQFGG